jgi:hypothetical protein
MTDYRYGQLPSQSLQTRAVVRRFYARSVDKSPYRLAKVAIWTPRTWFTRRDQAALAERRTYEVTAARPALRRPPHSM